MIIFAQTFQTAGYATPNPLNSDSAYLTSRCQTWQLLEYVNRETGERYDCYDQFKTQLHDVMHNRRHQPEF